MRHEILHLHSLLQLIDELLVPCSLSELQIAVGIVGALVMPHNIFLHSALVQSRKLDTSRQGAKKEAILYNAIESGVSLAVTVVINLFVMSVFAMGFYGTEADDEVGLSTAGKCASPVPSIFCGRVCLVHD
jgi:natural resistance-associated macrophage protein 2